MKNLLKIFFTFFYFYKKIYCFCESFQILLFDKFINFRSQRVEKIMFLQIICLWVCDSVRLSVCGINFVSVLSHELMYGISRNITFCKKLYKLVLIIFWCVSPNRKGCYAAIFHDFANICISITNYKFL